MTDARPTLGDYEHAAEVLTGVLSTTPLVETQALSDVLGAPVFLKLENLQRTGSFKIRGSSYLMSRLTAEERALLIAIADKCPVHKLLEGEAEIITREAA